VFLSKAEVRSTSQTCHLQTFTRTSQNRLEGTSDRLADIVNQVIKRLGCLRTLVLGTIAENVDRVCMPKAASIIGSPNEPNRP